jgi:hypothetical protein
MLGLIAAKYFYMVPRHILSTYLPLFMSSLQKFADKKLEMKVISGAFRGLNHFLRGCPGDFMENESNIATVFKYLRLALHPPDDLARYEIPKTACQFLARHAKVFQRYLAHSHKDIWEAFWKEGPSGLTGLCLKQDSKLRSRAFQAMEAFLSCVATELVDGKSSPDVNLITFQFFMAQFNRILSTRQAHVQNISLAIRGYGHFAIAIKHFWQAWQLQKTFNLLAQLSEEFCNGSAELIDETIMHLPSFVSAFANFVRELDVVDETSLEKLDRIIVQVFIIFPHLHRHQRNRYFKALRRLLFSVYLKGTALRQLMGRVSLEALSLSCSATAYGITAANSGGVNPGQIQPLYEDYFLLWEQLLSTENIPGFEVYKPQLGEFTDVIYSEAVRGILDFIRKLNLQIREDPDKLTFIEAVVPKDFTLFLNLVVLAEKLVLSSHTRTFNVEWMFVWLRQLIDMSSLNPGVSGFYKLLGFAMKIATQANYFDKISEALPNSEKAICFRLAQKYFSEVLVRLQQYNDELLAACVNFILTAPKELIVVREFLPVLQTCFRLGLGYLPSAELGLTALEYWLDVVRDDTLACLGEILPSLNDYLATASETKTEAPKDMPHPKRDRGKKEEGKTPFHLFQIRVVRFLGRLGGANSSLVQPVSAQTLPETAFGGPDSLAFKLNFQDLISDLILDSLLPRILELAEHSSRRPLKIAACELLHALVMFMLGQSLTRNPYIKLYKLIIPVLLRLSIDTDLVTRQLFSKLVFGLIHWWTREQKSEAENEEALLLLDSLFTGVGNSENGSLRDWGANCLGEYFEWSIRHTPRGSEASSPRVRSLLKRFFLLASNPDPHKRLGFFLTFLRIYRILREYDALIQTFIFDIGKHLFTALRLSHNDDSSVATLKLGAQCIDSHLSRILVERAATLNRPHHDVSGAADAVLPGHQRLKTERMRLGDFVDWLFKNSLHPERVFRQQCHRLFDRLVKVSNDSKDGPAWFSRRIATYSEQAFVRSLEPPLKGPATIENMPTRFELMEIPVDTYTWLFTTGYLSPSILRHSNMAERFAQIFEDFRVDVRPEYSRLEVEKFHHAKAQLILKLFNLCIAVLSDPDNQNPGISVILKVLEPKGYELLVRTILQPMTAGFQLAREAEENKLREVLSSLLRKLEQRVPNVMRKISHHLETALRTNMTLDLSNFDFNDRRYSLAVVKGLIFGYQIFRQYDSLSEPLYRNGSPQHLFQTIFESRPTGLAGSQLELAGNLLKLSLDMDPSADRLLRAILVTVFFYLQDEAAPSAAMTATGEDSQSLHPESQMEGLEWNNNAAPAAAVQAEGATSKGHAFYVRFQDQVEACVVTQPETYVPRIMSRMVKSQTLYHLVQRILSTRKRMVFEPFLHMMLPQIHLLTPWADGSAPVVALLTYEEKAQLLDLLKKMLTLNADTVLKSKAGREFVLRALSRTIAGPNLPLSFKNTALELLPAVLSSSHLSPAEFTQLNTMLGDLSQYDWPMTSSEMLPGTTRYPCLFSPHRYGDYTLSIDHLLVALERAGAVGCLNGVLTLLSPSILFHLLKEPAHRHKEMISSALARFVKEATTSVAEAVFSHCFEIATTQSIQEELQFNLITLVAIPLVAKMRMADQIPLFSRYIQGLIDNVARPPPDNLVEPLEKKSTLMRAVINYRILELIFCSVPASQLREQFSLGADLIKGLVKYFLRDIDFPMATAQPHVTSELVLNFHSSAFNACAALLLASQNNTRALEMLFFPKTRLPNWKHLVDDSKPLKFTVLTNFESARAALDALRSAPVSESDRRYDLLSPTSLRCSLFVFY